MRVQNRKPLTTPRTEPVSEVKLNAMLIISKTGNFSMLVGKVVRKKLATSEKVISLYASATVMRLTSSRFTKGSQIAERMAATIAAVMPCAAAAKTFEKKFGPSSVPASPAAATSARLGPEVQACSV